MRKNISYETYPPGARAFLSNPDYHDPTSPFCPHDAWVQQCIVEEVPKDLSNLDAIERQNRRLIVKLVLLGWSHENVLTYTYDHVVSYSLVMKSLSTGGNRAHGDWLNDTIVLTSSGVKHKIHFSSGAKWQIVCKDSFLPPIFFDLP